jgi:hypothetical protein
MMELNLRRRFFAEALEAVCGFRSPALTDAFAAVPRETFLPPGPWDVLSVADYTPMTVPRHVGCTRQRSVFRPCNAERTIRSIRVRRYMERAFVLNRWAMNSPACLIRVSGRIPGRVGVFDNALKINVLSVVDAEALPPEPSMTSVSTCTPSILSAPSNSADLIRFTASSG